MTVGELVTLLIQSKGTVERWSVLVDEGDGERSPVEVIDAEWNVDAKALVLRLDG